MIVFAIQARGTFVQGEGALPPVTTREFKSPATAVVPFWPRRTVHIFAEGTAVTVTIS